MLEPPSEVEVVIRPIRWLLEACRGDVTLTQAGYLPTTLVRDALATFDWWPEFLTPPRSEVDFHHLTNLRQVAGRLRFLTRRGRRLTISHSAARLLDEPIRLWGTLVLAIGCANPSTRCSAN